MSKRKKDSTPALSEQLVLIDMVPSEEGSMDISLLLKDSLSRAMRNTDLSRWQIAARISELVGRTLSKEMLDAYVAESKEGHNFPAKYLPGFCIVCDTLEPLAVLAGAVGGSVLGPKDAEFVEIARMEREKAELEDQIRKKKVKLGV